MLKSLLFRLLSSFGKPCYEAKEDNLAQFSQIDSIRLRGSKSERMAAIREWSKKENIEKRLKEFEAQAEKAYEAGKIMSQSIRKELGLPLEDPPIPDPLPKEFEGQAPSTVRAMLRQASSSKSPKAGMFGERYD